MHYTYCNKLIKLIHGTWFAYYPLFVGKLNLSVSDILCSIFIKLEYNIYEIDYIFIIIHYDVNYSWISVKNIK